MRRIPERAKTFLAGLGFALLVLWGLGECVYVSPGGAPSRYVEPITLSEAIWRGISRRIDSLLYQWLPEEVWSALIFGSLGLLLIGGLSWEAFKRWRGR